MPNVSEKKKPSRTSDEGSEKAAAKIDDGPTGLRRLSDLVKGILSVPKSSLTTNRPSS